MDSSQMPNNYASDPSVKYTTHYIELASDKVSFDNNIGKFVMTYLTPNLSTSAYDTHVPKGGSGNIINKSDNLGTTQITSSNYVELPVPKHLFYITDIKIKPNTTTGEYGLSSCAPVAEISRREYTKGQKFIVANIGGSVDVPVILGVVE